MKQTLSIERNSGWMLMLILGALILGSAALGWYVQRDITAQFEADARLTLNSVAALKAREIDLWRRERLATARIFQDNPDFAYEVHRLFTETDNPWPRTHLERWLGSYIHDGQYQRLLLFDATGREWLALPHATDHPHSIYLIEEEWSRLTGEITFLDLHSDQYGEGEESHVSLFVPLTYPTEQDPIGLLVMQIIPSAQLYPLLNEAIYAAGTSHTLLLRQEEDAFLLLNNPYPQVETALTLRIPLTEDVCSGLSQALMPSLASQGITPPPSLKTALAPVPDSPWVVGICADRAALAADVDARIRYLWVMIAATASALFIMGGLLWYRYRSEWYRRQYMDAQAIQSAQTQAEAEAERLRNLARQVPGVIYQFAYHPDGRSAFPYASEGIRAIYEVTPEEVRENADLVYQRLHPEDYDRVVAGILESYESGEAWHDVYRVILPERGLRWLEGNAKPEKQPDGSMIWHGFITEVTERKQAEDALWQATQRYQSLFNQSHDAIFLADLTGRHLAGNQRAIEMFGYTQEEMERMGAEDLSTNPSDSQQVIARLLAGEHIPTYERTFRRKNGQPITVELSVVLARTQDGEPLHIQSVARDITERKRVEEALRQSHAELADTLAALQSLQEQLVQQERLAAVGQLAAGIAHDFNNILAVILLYAQMLTRSTQLSDREREVVTTIVEQAQSAARLVEQILDFSRRSMLERKPLNWLSLLKEQVKMLDRALPEHVHVSLSAQPDLGYMVQADATRLQQMLLNLAINSRDAMPDGGELCITVDRVTVGEPTGELDAGEWVRLQVRDTGSGIPEEDQPYVFEPFFTTKEPGKGSGLGLAQAQGIVLQHGGHITFASAAGVGTTFTVYLPAIVTADPGPETSLPAQNGDQEHVLLVEDNPSVRAALMDALEILNYRVTAVENGRQALDYLEAHAPQVDAILSDMVMPDINGGQLFRAVKERGWPIPVIILTGHQIHEEIESLEREGLQGWLTKPVQIEELAELLSAALRTEEVLALT